MSAVEFAIPPWWPWLLLLPVLAAVAIARQVRRARAAERWLGERSAQLAGAPVHAGTRRALALAALGCAVLAWLQPVVGTAAGEGKGPDFVLALDVSWSMAAQDLQPSRLHRAVDELRALQRAAPPARAGLVAFAGEARLLVPLTTDLEAVLGVAERLAPGAELRGGTDLGAAIHTAAQALQRAGSRAGAIVVLSDGEDFGESGRIAALRALAGDVAVHCIGYGTAVGSKIAVDDEGGQTFLRDASGVEIITALDPAGLQAIAAAGGGEYASGADAGVLTRLYDRQLLPRARAERRNEPGTELAHRFQWPLLAALLLWMLRGMLPGASSMKRLARKRFAPSRWLLGAVLLTGPGPDPFEQAVADYRAARYHEALQAFQALADEAGAQATPELLGNLALAALRQRRPADAEPAARRLLETSAPAERWLGEFLLGQAAFERAELAALAASLPDAEPGAWQSAVDAAERALGHWRRAARRSGGWPEAVRNAERAVIRLEQLQKQRDEAEQKSKSEPAPETRPPVPEASDEPDAPDVAARPLPPAEVAKLLEQLQRKEREKRLLRRVTNRELRVGERDW